MNVKFLAQGYRESELCSRLHKSTTWHDCWHNQPCVFGYSYTVQLFKPEPLKIGNPSKQFCWNRISILFQLKISLNTETPLLWKPEPSTQKTRTTYLKSTTNILTCLATQFLQHAVITSLYRIGDTMRSTEVCKSDIWYLQLYVRIRITVRIHGSQAWTSDYTNN